jgi:hypothetical protein
LKRRRGQSLVETSLVLTVFLALLLGVFDCGQVLFAHQALVERVRTAVRWGTLHKWQGAEPVVKPDAIVNMVLYSQPQQPAPSREGYLGMKPENVQVTYHAATPEAPDDELLTVSIVNYESHFFSPWLARVLISHRPVMMSAPVEPSVQN